MKKLVVVFLVEVLAVAVLCLGAAETLVNRSGKTATGMVITFSEAVRITSYDAAVFPNQEPSGRAMRFMFNGGTLANGGRFRVSWSPSTTDIQSYEWLHDASSGSMAIALPSEPPAEVLGTCAYVDTTYGIPTIVVTSITTRDLRAAGIRIGDEITVTVGNSVLTMPLDYPPSCVPEGGCLAYLLWGDLRIYKRAGDFAADFGVSAGMPIKIRLIEKAKYARSTEVTDLDRYWSDHSVTGIAQATQLAAVPSSLSALHVSGSRILDAAGNTVVLRGVAVEDPYTARSGNTPVLKRDLLYLKALGANVIHIPVHPESWKLTGGETYVEGYLDDLVRWGGELGLYVAISWKTHGEPETKTINEERYDPDMVLALDALSLLAHRYANCPWVMYSIFNEPDAFTRWERFRLCMTDLVDAIRAQNPEAIVIVSGVDIATDLSAIPAAPIERENILYAADMYPWAWSKTPWKEDARALLDAGYPLIVFEWGFASREGEDHFAPPEAFGEPFLAFCEEFGISWTAWVWSHSWNPVMFYDYGRLRPTAFGQLVLAALYGGPLPAVAAVLLAISVDPPAAAAAGCRAFDRLEGNYGSIPATIVQAEAAQGWALDHWEGTLEGSSWLINSTLVGATVRAVFKPLFADSDQLQATQASEAGQSTGGGVRVLFDESHNERNTISPDRAAALNAEHLEFVLYQDFATELSTTYSVVRGTGPLTSNALAGVGVVVLAAPDGPFSPSERADLADFVSEGGGLLLLADAFPSQALNNLATAFGVTFVPGVVASHSGDWDAQSYWAPDVFRDHPITRAGYSFHTNWGCAIELALPGVTLARSKANTWDDEDADGEQDTIERAGPFALAVALESGAGRVVAIADNAFHDSMFGFAGNRALILGAIEWLSQATGDHLVDTKRTTVATAGDASGSTPVAGDAGGTPAQPDWATVSYSLLFAEPLPLVQGLFRGSEQLLVPEGTHWGLAGSDVKGVKLSYSSEGGMFVRLETRSAAVRGSYLYNIHFWPTEGGDGPFIVTLDPVNRSAWANMQYRSAWSDLPNAVRLVEVGDTYLVAYLQSVKLPSGEMLAETADWTPTLLETYVLPDGVWESYELAPIARDVAGLPTQPAGVMIPSLESLGNPFLSRYPTGLGVDYARTVWDMQVWNGRIYLGHGDTGSNAGPIDVWYYAPDQARLVSEFSVDDEQIGHYCPIGDSLLIPGYDAMESWDLGNLYVNEGTGWQKLRTIPNAIHVYDLAMYENRLYAAGSGQLPGSTTLDGGFIGVSDDGGWSWGIELHLGPFCKDGITRVRDASDPGVARFTSLFELQGRLFASGWGASRIYELGPDGFSLLEVDPFPGIASQFDEPPLLPPNEVNLSNAEIDRLWSDPKVAGYIARSVQFSGPLVYIGGIMSWTLYEPWQGIGVFAATAMQEGQIRRVLDLGATWEPRDLAVSGDELYVLSVSATDDGFRSRVDVTRDLSEWAVALDFAADAPAFSIEVLDGYLYLGLGGAYLSSGNIYRMKLSGE